MLHLAVPLLLAASGLSSVSARAPARAVQITLMSVSEERVCPGGLEPSGWRDPSNAWFFATGPTARLDDQELAAGVLAALIDLRFVRGALQLFVLGSPLRSGLQFTSAGWHARWPFC
jgi:hypothetical protein